MLCSLGAGDVLEAAGGDLAQGYFIAKPMDEGRFPAFCAAASGRSSRIKVDSDSTERRAPAADVD